MSAFKDITGNRYNKLLVTSLAYIRKGSSFWNCKCDCGNEKIINIRSLNNGHTQSCGCLKKIGIKLEKGVASFNTLFYAYQKSAKRRNISFVLTEEEFKSLTLLPCFYCGKEPSQIYKSNKYGNGNYIYNGIDRVNNSLGYILDNCVPCCGICNRAKDVMTKEEFLNWIETVYAHSFERMMV